MIIKTDEVKLDNNQILKHLGYKTKSALDDITKKEIAESIKLLKTKSQSKFIYKVYEQFDINEENIKFDEHFQVESKNLSKHLKGAKCIIIIAVTLGIQVDGMIKKEMLIAPSKGLILDAVASEYIEACTNLACEHITRRFSQFRNARFSPGYGDLSLKVQEEIVEALGAKKSIGLHTNKSYLLLPSKSITAFFGMYDTEKILKKSCNNCHLVNNCKYRNEGVYCYDQTREK